MIDDFDYESPSNYKGFDLSDIDERDLSDLMEKIDLIHENMNRIKELCKKLVSIYEPIDHDLGTLKKTEPDVHQTIMEEAINLYGDEKGREFVELILGKLDQDSLKIQKARARAFIISYDRQFDEDYTDPIHPSEFQESDVFKTMQKLTGGKNPLPNLSSSG